MISDQCSAFDLYKTEVLAVIIVARLHSPATSNDQHSSHQTCSMAQANVSVTIPYAREKFNRLWKTASIDLFSTEHGLVTMPPTDGSMILRHLLSTPRWHPKSEIEWHWRHVGLANDLISSCSPSSNTITNLVQCENIAKCSLMKLQQTTAVLNVIMQHKHTRSKFHKLYTSESNR